MRRLLVAGLFLLLNGCPATNPAADVPLDGDAARTGDTASGIDSVGFDTLPPYDSRPTDPLPISDLPPFDAGLPTTACAPLPPPTGTVVRVMPSQADQLPMIVASASTGTTILLADGTYRMTTSGESARRINFRTAGVTLRSASGNPEAVILDGEYQTNEMLFVEASDVTIAEITVQRAIDHPIHVTAPAGGPNTRNTRLYRLRVIDGGEQFIKVNPPGSRDAFADDGVLECSYLELTNEGRPRIERNPGGCYTGGIDAHGARNWTVRSNTFVNIYCAGEGLAEHAIHFWSASRDTLVENNTIVNCARGIGFGLVEMGATRDYADNPYPGIGYIGHYDGIIRNNVIWADIAFYDTGIELDQARGAQVHHNSIIEGDGSAASRFSSIDARFANTLVRVRNNLVRRLTTRNGATRMDGVNLENVPLNYFAAPATGDYHLTPMASMAIDRGEMFEGLGVDIDGESHTRGSAPDLGADER